MAIDLVFAQISTDDESIVEAIRLAASESAHLKLSDAPSLRAALYVAKEIDETLPAQRYEVSRNLAPTLLKYLDALGFTPQGRKALGLMEPDVEVEGDDLDALQDAVPGLRAVK